jgi:hypothetical protein
MKLTIKADTVYVCPKAPKGLKDLLLWILANYSCKASIKYVGDPFEADVIVSGESSRLYFFRKDQLCYISKIPAAFMRVGNICYGPLSYTSTVKVDGYKLEYKVSK